MFGTKKYKAPDAQHQPQKFMRESMSSRTRSCAINSHREGKSTAGPLKHPRVVRGGRPVS
jgi:hypothetical protein